MEAEVEAEADNPGLASERRRRLWASNLVWEISNFRFVRGSGRFG